MVTLCAVASKAHRTRGSRKAIRFPSRRTYYADEGNYLKEIFRYLVRLGNRTFNDLYLAGYSPAAESDLAEIFAEVVFAKGDIADDFAPRRGSSIATFSSADKTATEAASSVANRWTPDYIREQVERGRRGGERSRRGASYGPDRLDGLEGLTIAQQAFQIGCSERTVVKLRKSRKAPPVVTGDLDIDASLAGFD